MDFDSEDWSVFGGLSEEFSDDFKQEYYAQKEQISEYVVNQNAESGLKRTNRQLRKRPFERYVDDIIHGVKTFDDPLVSGYDIDRRVNFPKADKKQSELSIADVEIYNSHLVSKAIVPAVRWIL